MRPSFFAVTGRAKRSELILRLPDGTVAAIGAAGGDKPGGFVARISHDRTRQVVVHLRPFLAKAVTIAAGGVIWTVGWVWDGETVSQNNVMERFDSSGRLAGTPSPLPCTGDSPHPMRPRIQY